MGFIFYSFWYDCCFLLVSFITLSYVFFKHKNNYWKNKGVPGPEPTLIIGNMGDMLSLKQDLGGYCEHLYQTYKNHPFIGIHLMQRPVLVVNDLDLIKTMLIKDFNYFTDHGFEFDIKSQPLANHLFNNRGIRWKNLRNKLTPAFTSSKMKYMFETMAACGEEMKNYLKNSADEEAEVDIKDTLTRYTMDIISSVAFGLESNCFKNPNSEFKIMGNSVFNLDFKRKIAMFLVIFMPKIYKQLKISVLEKKVSNFFISIVKNTVKYREENKISRNDLMQLLIRLKNNENIDDDSKERNDVDINLTPLELAALSFGFFVGGFETSSTTSIFIFTELARNPDIQKKLRKEIDDVLEKYDGKVTYESINEMSYLTQVIEETMRLYPIVPQMFRVCTKQYTIPNTNVVIEKGTLVLVSTIGIQRDPDIYPDPNTFNPDNFSPDNKASRHSCSFLAFGEGPRICIGLRFAMLQMKIALVSILRHYEVKGNEEEIECIKSLSFIMSPKNSMIRLINRTDK